MDETTERLHIRDLQRSDLEEMIALWTDPDVRRTMGDYGPQSSEDVLPWIESAIAHNAARPRYAHNCAIVERVSGTVIGWIGFGHPDEERAKWGERDFGYALRPAFRSRGYGSEALRAAIDYCFHALGVRSFFGETAPDNVASARAMQKAGMTAVGTAADGSIVYRIERRPEAPAAGAARDAREEKRGG